MQVLNIHRQGDWAGVKAHLACASPDAAYQAIVDLAFGLPVRKSVEALVAAPDDVLGLTLAGGVLRYQAWRLRGALVAAMTSAERFARYYEALEQALGALNAALQLVPTNGLASALLASACLDADPQDKADAEVRLIAANDAPVIGHLELMTAWTDKWGGSQGEMWAYLARNERRAAPGTLALVPRAHWEQKNYLELAGAQRKADGYYRREAVRKALVAASDESLAASPDNPHGLRAGDPWFALTLVGAGETARARRHFQRLGRYIDPTVWHYGLAFISPGVRFAFNRLRAGLL
jgi:hypothetical protein